MKMGGAVKGLGSLAVVVVAYINQNFSPLAWVLGVLVVIDLVINAHDEEKAWKKIVSTFTATGGTVFLAQNLHTPEFAKLVVAVLTIVYIQVVFPTLGKGLNKVVAWAKAGKSAAAVDVEMLLKNIPPSELQAFLNQAQAKVTAEAQTEEQSILNATTGGK